MSIETGAHRPHFLSLRAVVWLSALVPLVIYGAIAAFRLHESSQTADLRVSRSLRVAHEHATKVLAAAEAFQERMQDLVTGKSEAELRAREAEFHKIFVEKVRDGQQIQSIWIVGADGRPIATSISSPPPSISFSDREYFKHHAAGNGERFLSPPFKSRTADSQVLDVSARFHGSGGKFGGVVTISLHTSYFERFYEDLVNDEPGLAVNLFRQDGPIYTRWPVLPNAPDRLGSQSPTLQAVASGAPSGIVRGTSSVDGRDRLVAFERVGSYPLFVGTGMDITSVRAETFREIAFLLAIGLPPFAAIFFAARVALRRANEAYEAAERLSVETLTRRKAEEALLQAQKLEAMCRLTGGVAHDFNNALMVISNNAFLLRRHVPEDGIAQLNSIGRAVDSATKLTRQLLAFSRRQALVPEKVDLRMKLPASEALLVPVLGSQVGLKIEVAPDTHAVTVDMAELELALLNVAINARDAMGSGGSFLVSAKNAEHNIPLKLHGRPAVVIEARDTGTGIPPEILEKVFEPFFTTKPVGSGTGLGLSQVYGFCERAGGMATVHSEVGRGTTVCLFFPAATGFAPEAVEVRAPIRRDLNRTVLLVEDNDEVAASLTPLLEALGCEVSRVDRAAGALEWLAARASPPHLVLTDVVMPGDMDGLGLALRLRETHPSLKVVLMTGYAERMDSIELQGFDVLPKPCQPEKLVAVIASGAQSA